MAVGTARAQVNLKQSWGSAAPVTQWQPPLEAPTGRAGWDDVHQLKAGSAEVGGLGETFHATQVMPMTQITRPAQGCPRQEGQI